MTSTVSSAPVVSRAFPKALLVVRARLWGAGRTRLWSGVILLLLVVIAVFWSIGRWGRSAGDSTDVTRGFVSRQTFDVSLKEKGELKAAKSTEIICEVEGKSTIITLIPEGTPVKKGDLLVELAGDQIEERIRETELKESNAITAYEAAKTELEVQRDKNASDVRKANLQIELKQLELKKYEEGDWAQKRKDADIAIEQAQINLQRRTEDFDASKQLRERNFITESEYEEDEFNFLKAQWELEKAGKAKEVLEIYTHVAELRQRESDLDEATKEFDRVKKNAEAEETKKSRELDGKKKELELIQDQLAKFRTQREKCRIFAPTEGFVIYYSEGGGRHFMSGDSQVREGATVYERQVLLTLPNTTEMLVLLRVHEAKTDKLSLHQPVRVQVEGIPGREFAGTVTKIAAVADTQNRWLNPDLKEYETEITLDPVDVPLKPGVTAYCEILVETVENKLAVPVHTIYSKGSRRYVFRADRRSVTPVEVKLGAIGTEWAEISQGLSGGEKILLAFTDEHKRQISEPRGAEKRNGGFNDGALTGHDRPPGAAQPKHDISTPPGVPAAPRPTRASTGAASSSEGAVKTKPKPSSP